jgi:hypothetical protein
MIQEMVGMCCHDCGPGMKKIFFEADEPDKEM